MKIVWKMIRLAVLLSLFEMMRELRSFRVTRYPVVSKKLRGTKYRILFLSDLHNYEYGEKNDTLLLAVKKEKPDLILIGGDMLVGKKDCSFRVAADFVKKLTLVCPVYYANGNHEQRMKEKTGEYGMAYSLYQRELLEAGVHFLENESEEIPVGGDVIRVTGLEIPGNCYTRFQKVKLEEKEIIRRVGRCDKTSFQILLAHNPAYMKEYLFWGADLILSGHLHGGVVRIPGLGGIISPGFVLFPRYSGGCYYEKEQTVVVSKGMGSHTIPIRLFNPAEIVVLELSGCGTGENPV